MVVVITLVLVVALFERLLKPVFFVLELLAGVVVTVLAGLPEFLGDLLKLVAVVVLVVFVPVLFVPVVFFIGCGFIDFALSGVEVLFDASGQREECEEEEEVRAPVPVSG